MKTSKYKIYKQIGIQELVPFKLNVKLFKQLIIAKFIFIYFFYKEQLNKKYQSLRRKLYSFSKYQNIFKLDNLNLKQFKLLNIAKINNINNNTEFYNKLKTYMRTTYHPKNQPKQFFKKNVRWMKNNLIKKKNFFLKRTKPLKFELNSINLNLFKSNLSTLKTQYKWKQYNLFELITNSRLLYLKLNNFKRIYIHNSLSLKILKLKYIKIMKILLYYLKKQLCFLMILISLLKSNKIAVNSNIFHNYVKFTLKIKQMFNSLKGKKLILFLNLFNQYINHYTLISMFNKQKKQLNILFKNCLNNNKSLIEVKNNKIFWMFLAQFFFLKDYELKKKKPFFKFRFQFKNIHLFLYKKYIAELNRSQMFIKFVYSILNYKQQKQIKQFFIQMYRRKYFKQNYIQFHNTNSYYKTQKTILLILDNKKNKSKRTIYDFKKSLISLFQIKIGKVLYKLKKTTDYFKVLNFFKKKYISPNLLNNLNFNQISHIFESIYKLNFKTIDLLQLKNKLILNNVSNLNQFKLLTYSPTVGDTLRIRRITNLNYHFNKTFIYYLHFYLMLLFLFLNKKLNSFQSFGYFRFFFHIFLYKLSYIIIYHINKYKYLEKKNEINKFKIKKQLYLFNNTKNKYEVLPLNSLSIVFNYKPVYIHAPFSLEKANIDAFYQLKFKKKKTKSKTLAFLNFFSKLSFYKKMMHNQFHIMRYYNFIKTIKKNILSFLQSNFLYNNKTILFVNVHNDYTDMIINQNYFFKNNMTNYLSSSNFNLSKLNNNSILNRNNSISYKYLK